MTFPASTGTDGTPLISVILPVYNRASKIAEAMQSIRAAGRSDLELIVVDDGSSDGSAEAAERAVSEIGLQANAFVLRQANAGPGAARNAGARIARGRFIAFFDSDDLWMPWTVDLVISTVRAHPDAALFFLQELSFTKRAAFETPVQADTCVETYARFLDAIEAVWSLPYASCNAVIRRSHFEALNGFTEEIRCAEDTDLFLRADELGSCVLVRSPVMVGRETGTADSLTANIPCVVEGLNFLIAREDAGLYPGGTRSNAKRSLLLAGSIINTIRMAFANGFPGMAYSVLLSNRALLKRSGRGNMFLRLLLTPVLSKLKPQYYRFRLRPPPST